ncbi:MAG TPA: energy transducer TonB [Vicinamibacterales bacterium]|nr:energy transducer TonB [Vicinamibacterales bacterium]
MRKYTLFLSILVHVVGAAALFVVPLLALDSLPSVRDRATWIAARAVEPPPPQPPAVGPARAAASLAVPVEAPSGLPPDSDQPADGPGVPSFEPAGGGGDVPGGIGGGGIAIAPPPPPPPAPEARRIVRAGSVLAPPRKIVDVAPIYPRLAAQAGVSGIVVLEAVIAEDGTVRDLKVLRSVPLLDQAAIDAVRQWRYTPTTLGGVAVSVVMTVTVNFALR